jgi:exodeoxyribonuclease VII large subunit
VRIDVLPVQVQGEPAVPEIVRAVERFNAAAQPPEVLVLTRGGGSADDLAAFSAEPVVRAVAASRIPTLVAIGHEIDTSLAELAADRRASTPSNAAEILVPDRRAIMRELDALQLAAARHASQLVTTARTGLEDAGRLLQERAHRLTELAADRLQADHRLLQALDPAAALGRGYVLLRQNGQLVRTTKQLRSGPAAITFADGAAPVILEVSNDN